jgi:hypothetical protein
MQFASALQTVGHVVSAPSQTYGVHDGLPGLVAGAAPQLPVAHVAQAPGHAVLQQMPLTQKPRLHWSAAVQFVPLICKPTQIPPTQVPLEHWSPAAHVVPIACFATQLPALQ